MAEPTEIIAKFDAALAEHGTMATVYVVTEKGVYDDDTNLVEGRVITPTTVRSTDPIGFNAFYSSSTPLKEGRSVIAILGNVGFVPKQGWRITTHMQDGTSQDWNIESIQTSTYRGVHIGFELEVSLGG